MTEPEEPLARAGAAPADPPQFRPFERLRTERIYDSRWCGLRRDHIRLPNGQEQDYHVFELCDAVAVVPVLADGRIALIGQYRYPHGKTHWEIPAGRLHDGEPPRAGAARELLEETGLRAARFEPLPGFYAANGITDHYAHAFVAEGCTIVADPRPDDAEQLFRQLFTRAEIEALLDSGRFADAFTALCIAYWLRRCA